MNARWNLVLLPSAIVSLLLLFGTQFVFLIQTIPRSLEEAARIHGASRWRTMWRVVIPLSLPGIVNGSLIVFNLSMGAFVSAALLGGGKVLTLPVVIERTIVLETEYAMGGALSAILLGTVLLINIVSVLLVQMFKSGDVLVAIAHAGWGVRLHDAGVPVGMIHPMVKDRVGLASRGYAGVVAGTRHKAAAEFCINELVSEGMQEVLHTKNGIVPTNRKVQVKYSGDPKLDSTGVPFLMLSPDQIANLYYMDWSGFSMKDWTRKWNRIVASQ